MTYWVEFSEYTYQISPPEEGDGPWLHQGDYGLTVSINKISTTQLTGWDAQQLSDYDDIYGYDEIEPGQNAYLLVVTYTTGGTFGSHGAWTIPAVKADLQDAYTAQRLCHADNNQKRTNRMYRPWDGYFEHLESVDVTPLILV